MQINSETGFLIAQLFFAVVGLVVVFIALPTVIHDSKAGYKST